MAADITNTVTFTSAFDCGRLASNTVTFTSQFSTGEDNTAQSADMVFRSEFWIADNVLADNQYRG